MLQQPACAHCGKFLPLSKHTGRRRRFCSLQCRVAEFRYGKTAPRSEGTGCNETRPKNSTKSGASAGHFRGRGIDLIGLEPELRQAIIAAEIGFTRKLAPASNRALAEIRRRSAELQRIDAFRQPKRRTI
jgi:hypothetical protein